MHQSLWGSIHLHRLATELEVPIASAAGLVEAVIAAFNQELRHLALDEEAPIPDRALEQAALWTGLQVGCDEVRASLQVAEILDDSGRWALSHGVAWDSTRKHRKRVAALQVQTPAGPDDGQCPDSVRTTAGPDGGHCAPEKRGEERRREEKRSTPLPGGPGGPPSAEDEAWRLGREAAAAHGVSWAARPGARQAKLVRDRIRLDKATPQDLADAVHGYVESMPEDHETSKFLRPSTVWKPSRWEDFRDAGATLRAKRAPGGAPVVTEEQKRQQRLADRRERWTFACFLPPPRFDRAAEVLWGSLYKHPVKEPNEEHLARSLDDDPERIAFVNSTGELSREEKKAWVEKQEAARKSQESQGT